VNTSLVEIRNLSIAFAGRRVVDGVSLTIERGKTLGIVGESGSGKSLTALSLMGLVPAPGVVAGDIRFDRLDIGAQSEAAMRSLRGRRLAMIFQDPSSALNPVFTVGAQIAEAYRLHHAASRADAEARALAALHEVAIPDPELRARSYPHQLSGGMRQRAMIAMALVNEPELLIADEPTTALDATVQAQILELIRALQARRGVSVLFISHDLRVVADMADDVVVMRHGKIVERAAPAQLFESPAHDYTRALIRAAELPPKRASAPPGPTLIEVQGLTKHFALKAPGLFGRRLGTVQALTDVSFTVARGETFAIVGESGCGKSTLARTLLGLHEANAGGITLDGVAVAPQAADRTPALRRRLQMVFQDPYGSLNPRLTAAESVAEPLVIHGIGGTRERSAEAARAVGLEPGDLAKFPHAFSGGERQRIAIARALVAEPDLIVADEPLSSLDVSIQAQIIELLSRLKEERSLTYIFISHDLPVVAHLADRVAVMYLGRIVETAQAESLFVSALHPYTQMLLAASPRKLGEKRARQSSPRGEPASSVHPPPGCPFHPRCPKVQEICRVERPVLAPKTNVRAHHLAACHFPDAV